MPLRVELVTEARLYFDAEKKMMMVEITRSLYDVDGSDVKWLGSSSEIIPLRTYSFLILRHAIWALRLKNCGRKKADRNLPQPK